MELVLTMIRLPNWPNNWWKMRQVEKLKSNRTKAGRSKCRISKCELSISCLSMWNRKCTKAMQACRSNLSEAYSRGYPPHILTNIKFCSKGLSQFSPWWLNKASRLLILLSLFPPALEMAMLMKQSFSYQRWADFYWSRRKSQVSRRPTLTASSSWPSIIMIRVIRRIANNWSQPTKTCWTSSLAGASWQAPA